MVTPGCFESSNQISDFEDPSVNIRIWRFGNYKVFGLIGILQIDLI